MAIVVKVDDFPAPSGVVPICQARAGAADRFAEALRDRLGGQFAPLTPFGAEEPRWFGPDPLAPGPARTRATTCGSDCARVL